MAKQKVEGGMAEAMRATRKVGARSGFVKATFSLDPEQLAGVVAEANRRALARGAMRSDASEVVREAIVAWLGRRKR
jgi:carbamoylphosphate synthase large subunit